MLFTMYTLNILIKYLFDAATVLIKLYSLKLCMALLKKLEIACKFR
jgi:hypothetical protein